MYTRNIISQQISKTSPSETNFVSFKSAYTERTLPSYIQTLRGDGKAILTFLMNFRSASTITLKNSTISAAVGCCIRTVQRWTKKFVHDGFLAKTQINDDGILNIYTPNRYKLGLSKSAQFAYWSAQNPDKAETYNTYGILVKRDGKYSFQIETVTHNKSYIKNNIFINKPTPVRLRVTCARARTTDPSWDIFPKKETKREIRLRESREMLQEEQRKWIQRNKNQGALKDLLLKEPIRSHIFTPQIEEISQLLELNERERLKLVAFPDDAINNLLSVVKPIVTEKRSINIKDRVGWIMSLLVKYCASHNITVEWPWYFSVCEILGIKALQSGEESRPLKISSGFGRKVGAHLSPQLQDCTSDAYRRAHEWRAPEEIIAETRNIDDRISFLEQDLVKFEEVIKSPTVYPFLLKTGQDAIANIKREIADLKEKRGGV